MPLTRLAHLALLAVLASPATSRAEPDNAPAQAAAPQPDSTLLPRREQLHQRRIERLEQIYGQRTLRNHPFIAPQSITSALVETRLGSVLGVGLATIEGDADSQQSGGWVAATAGLDAGLRLHPRVGLRAGVDGSAGLGASGGAAMNAGAGASWQWMLGGTVSLLRKDAGGTALALSPEVGRQSGSSIQLGPALDLLEEQAREDDVDLEEVAEALLVQSNTWNAGLGLGLAQAFGRAAGVQLGLEAGWRERSRSWYDQGAQQDQAGAPAVGGGLALTFDANPVPLAVLLEYRALDVLWDTGAALEHTAGGGLYLNGMTNAIGIRVDTDVAPDAPTVFRAQVGYQAWL